MNAGEETGSGPPEIDWTKAGELRDDVGGEAFREVVDLLLVEVEEALEALMHGPGLEAQLHFLKGAALNLGFTEFAALCQQGETLAGAGRAREVRLHPLRAAYGRARDHFLAEWEWRLAA